MTNNAMMEPTDNFQWLEKPNEVRPIVVATQRAGRRVGLVPTMGNLHAGHASLVQAARRDCDLVITTIFVNPTQFLPGEDFEQYPRTPAEDEQLLRKSGCNIVFAPSSDVMYPPGARTRVVVEKVQDPLCGQSRPGHFVGVATIVAKLFNLIPADIAYFGQKDFQQVRVIERMVADLNFPIQISVQPTVREPDGLALSSRNAYLTIDQRRHASVLKRSLELVEQQVLAGERVVRKLESIMERMVEATPGAVLDYARIVDSETLESLSELDRPAVAALAVRFGKTRLIDNLLVQPVNPQLSNPVAD